MTTLFQQQYRDLEDRMRRLAEAEGDVYLPNPKPKGPVDYVLICMEPSFGKWAGGSVPKARERVDAGFRNFLNGMDSMLLHFCVRRFLCNPEQTYHITDFSKGAMPVERAAHGRGERYARWYSLLKDELELISKPDARVIAVGNQVYTQLNRSAYTRPVTPIIHYSSQAGRARAAGVAGHEKQFDKFKAQVSREDVISVAHEVLIESGVPAQIYNEAIATIQRARLSESRIKLIFNYKLDFEKLLSQAI